MTFDQAEFDIRCEWGESGVRTLAPISDALVIVDVMSFSTVVAIATARGASVYPYRSKESSAGAFAKSIGAELAGPRGNATYSLSPISVMSIPAGTRLVLPGPNGAVLSLLSGDTPTFAGSLRNARVVAEAASRCGRRVSVIPCGERWKGDGSLRPAFEDLIGAGAIIRHLVGCRSPEAQAAVRAFEGVMADLGIMLRQCSSGKELVAMGCEEDIPLCGEVDVDDCASVLQAGAYRKAEPPAPGDAEDRTPEP